MPSLTPGMLVVFGLVLLAGVLFATEWVPNEIVALLVAVLLAMLERWTGVGAEEAVSGFASPATVTVLAMFILTEGIRASGLMQRLGRKLASFAGGSERRRLAATLLLGGPLAGFVNNTPLVSVLVPAITDLSRRSRSSPSRLLMPLSFVAMMGGMLTVIGTSTSLLASDLSGRLLEHPIGMFEFTPLGILILAVGGSYLLAVGWRLVPERVRPEEDLTAKFRVREYLSRSSVPEGSPLVGRRIRDLALGETHDLDVLQVVRDSTVFLGPTTDQALEAGDVLTIRAAEPTLAAFASAEHLEPHRLEEVADDAFVDREHTLLEVTLAPDSELAGETLVSCNFRNRYAGTVIAVQRGDRVVRDQIERFELQDGDSLLVLVARKKVPVLDAEPDLVITHVTPADPWWGRVAPSGSRRSAAPGVASAPGGGSSVGGKRGDADGDVGDRPVVALGIVGAVIATAALGVWPIYIAALAGVVALVLTRCVTTSRAYQAVSWDIYFLLAGILPLGVALERTGGAAFLAELVLARAEGLAPVLVMGLFYLVTALLSNLISANASVVLMIPIAVDAAAQIGAQPFSFLLAVTFAATAAFMTPVGNQVNLLVYTPGGYRFRDYLVAGAPLQLLLAVTTTAGIALFWGV